MGYSEKIVWLLRSEPRGYERVSVRSNLYLDGIIMIPFITVHLSKSGLYIVL